MCLGAHLYTFEKCMSRPRGNRSPVSASGGKLRAPISVAPELRVGGLPHKFVVASRSPDGFYATGGVVISNFV